MWQMDWGWESDLRWTMILTVISNANQIEENKKALQIKGKKNTTTKTISRLGDVWARWYQPSNTYNTYSAYIYIFMMWGSFKG